MFCLIQYACSYNQQLILCSSSSIAVSKHAVYKLAAWFMHQFQTSCCYTILAKDSCTLHFSNNSHNLMHIEPACQCNYIQLQVYMWCVTKLCVIKSGYALAPVQAELSAYSLPDQPINNCYTPGLLSIIKLYVFWAKRKQ